MAIDEDELKKIIEPKAEIEEISSISSDGRNLLTRIPKKIVEKADIKKGQNIRWLINGDNELKIELIKENDNNKKKESN